jgi:dUTP pyrophosphatase
MTSNKEKSYDQAKALEQLVKATPEELGEAAKHLNTSSKQSTVDGLNEMLKETARTTVEVRAPRVSGKATKKKKNADTVKVEVIKHPLALLPEYKTSGAAGMDMYANITLPLWISPGEVKAIPTGIKTVIPKGYCLEVYSRSGLALKKGVFILNSPGLIDDDYREELMILLANFSQEKFQVNKGDRIAQLRLKRVEKIEWVEITDENLQKIIKNESSDRLGGFGSTGSKY